MGARARSREASRTNRPSLMSTVEVEGAGTSPESQVDGLVRLRCIQAEDGVQTPDHRGSSDCTASAMPA